MILLIDIFMYTLLAFCSLFLLWCFIRSRSCPIGVKYWTVSTVTPYGIKAELRMRFLYKRKWLSSGLWDREIMFSYQPGEAELEEWVKAKFDAFCKGKIVSKVSKTTPKTLWSGENGRL